MLYNAFYLLRFHSFQFIRRDIIQMNQQDNQLFKSLVYFNWFQEHWKVFKLFEKRARVIQIQMYSKVNEISTAFQMIQMISLFTFQILSMFHFKIINMNKRCYIKHIICRDSSHSIHSTLSSLSMSKKDKNSNFKMISNVDERSFQWEQIQLELWKWSGSADYR